MARSEERKEGGDCIYLWRGPGDSLSDVQGALNPVSVVGN